MIYQQKASLLKIDSSNVNQIPKFNLKNSKYRDENATTAIIRRAMKFNQ